MMKAITSIIRLFVFGAVLFLLGWLSLQIYHHFQTQAVLRQVIGRLSADSRVAEVLVTKSVLNEKTRLVDTTIKFLEYDIDGNPLPARYFTFHGNIIQFQALVVRFHDSLIELGDQLKGKSIFLFLRAFVLDKDNSQVFDLTPLHEIPAGYKVPGARNEFEEKIWSTFWDFALNPKKRDGVGIKNAQIEAPGSLFLPGTIYTIRIEHDGGLRIDTQPVPVILRGENVQ
jgi:hypothetical protein